MNMRKQFKRTPSNHLIKKRNICNIPLSESEEYYGIFKIFQNSKKLLNGFNLNFVRYVNCLSGQPITFSCLADLYFDYIKKVS